MTNGDESELPPCPFCDSAARISESISIGCSNMTSCPSRPKVFSTDLDTAKAKWAHRTRSVNLEGMTDEQLRWLVDEASKKLHERFVQEYPLAPEETWRKTDE